LFVCGDRHWFRCRLQSGLRCWLWSGIRGGLWSWFRDSRFIVWAAICPSVTTPSSPSLRIFFTSLSRMSK
jgi:hypothetical protein